MNPEQMYRYLLDHSNTNYELLVKNKERLLDPRNLLLLEDLFENEKSFQKSDEACGR